MNVRNYSIIGKKVNTKRQANYRDLMQNVNNNSITGSSHGKIMLSSSYYGGVRWYCKKIWNFYRYLDEGQRRIYLSQLQVIPTMQIYNALQKIKKQRIDQI